MIKFEKIWLQLFFCAEHKCFFIWNFTFAVHKFLKEVQNYVSVLQGWVGRCKSRSYDRIVHMCFLRASYCFHMQGPQVEATKQRRSGAGVIIWNSNVWYRIYLILPSIISLQTQYSWTSLFYAIDRDQKIWLSYNKSAYKKTKNDCKLGDTVQKNGQFAIADTRICR